MDSGDIEGGGEEELRSQPLGFPGVGRKYTPVAANDRAVLQMSSLDPGTSSSAAPSKINMTVDHGMTSEASTVSSNVYVNGTHKESKLELFGFDSLVNILGLKSMTGEQAQAPLPQDGEDVSITLERPKVLYFFPREAGALSDLAFWDEVKLTMETVDSQEHVRGSNDIHESNSSSPLFDHSTTQHNSHEEAAELPDVSVGATIVENDGVESTVTKSGIKRGRTSDVWKHFKLIDDEISGIPYGICNYCDKRYKADSHGGTSTLLKHLKYSCKEFQKLKPTDNATEKEFDQNAFRRLLAEALIRHGYSFSWVEHEATRKIFKYLNDKVQPISRNTVRKECVEMHAKLKENILHVFEGLPGRVCLTCDLWSACTHRGYLCVTAHYIDENWTLHSKVISFKHVSPPHRGYELSLELKHVICDWGLSKKLFSLTVDNASNMDTMVSNLIDAPSIELPLEGKYFHVRCAAHILNLTVHSGLKVIESSVFRLREGIKYIDGSESRKIRFLEICKDRGTTYSGGLWLDVPTRWNSTFLMIEKACKYRDVLSHYFNDMGALTSRYHVSANEWDQILKIKDLLEPFYEITKLFSGRQYPTSNLYFIQVYQIYIRLKMAMIPNKDRYGNDVETEITIAAFEMLEKFKKYWEDYVMVLAFGVVFDPQRKLSFVKFAFNGTHGSFEADEMVKNVRQQMEELFQGYLQDSAVGESGIQVGVEREIQFQNIEEFELYDPYQGSKNELDMYLDEARCKISDNFDILAYWKQNSTRFPTLSRMARDILAIPITTVASESTFSIGGRILNKWRSCLTDDNIEVLVTTNNWLTGFDDFTPGESEAVLVKLPLPTMD